MSFDRYLVRVGQRVQKARWLKELTQQQVADEAGITYRYYQELEQGRVNPTLRTLYTIGRVLGRSVAELVDAQPRPKGQTPLGEAKAVPPRRGRKPGAARKT